MAWASSRIVEYTQRRVVLMKVRRTYEYGQARPKKKGPSRQSKNELTLTGLDGAKLDLLAVCGCSAYTWLVPWKSFISQIRQVNQNWEKEKSNHRLPYFNLINNKSKIHTGIPTTLILDLKAAVIQRIIHGLPHFYWLPLKRKSARGKPIYWKLRWWRKLVVLY